MLLTTLLFWGFGFEVVAGTSSDCIAPSAIENGYFYCEEAKCFLECDRGYVADGRITTLCSEGSWSPSVNEMTCSPGFVLAVGGTPNSSTVEVYGAGFHKRLPNIPSPRMGHAVENVDGHIIFCGGVVMEFVISFPVPNATADCFEMTDDFEWVPYYPYNSVGRDIHASIALHGSIFWIGGHLSPGTVEWHAPEGQKFKDEWGFEDLDPYMFKHACAAKISPIEILVTGGFYDARLTLKYNILTGDVEKLDDMAHCHSGHGCNYIKDDELGIEGVVVGGGYPNCDKEELNLEVSFAVTSGSEFYDLKTGKWRDIGDMTEEKRGHRMTFAQGSILSFGGMTALVDDDPDSNIQHNYFGWMHPEDFWFIPYVDKYDPVTETWSHTDDMLFGRNFPAVTLISERRFFFGCLAPPTPQFGSFNCPTYPEANEEKKCTLECDPGYAPDGSTTSICTEGSWAPSLTEMTCSPIVNEEICSPACPSDQFCWAEFNECYYEADLKQETSLGKQISTVAFDIQTFAPHLTGVLAVVGIFGTIRFVYTIRKSNTEFQKVPDETEV